MALADNHEAYFQGETLYGEELSLEEIEPWREDEREGYTNFGARTGGLCFDGRLATSERWPDQNDHTP